MSERIMKIITEQLPKLDFEELYKEIPEEDFQYIFIDLSLSFYTPVLDDLLGEDFDYTVLSNATNSGQVCNLEKKFGVFLSENCNNICKKYIDYEDDDDRDYVIDNYYSQNIDTVVYNYIYDLVNNKLNINLEDYDFDIIFEYFTYVYDSERFNGLVSPFLINIQERIENLFNLTGREATTILNKEIKEYFDEKLEEQRLKKNNIK